MDWPNSMHLALVNIWLKKVEVQSAFVLGMELSLMTWFEWPMWINSDFQNYQQKLSLGELWQSEE